MKQLKYDMWSADVQYKVQGHPQEVMKNLGFKLINSVPQSIADCWWFTVEDFDFELPPYLSEIKYNLNYWMYGCYKNCEYFNMKYNSLEDEEKYCCYGGLKCKKAQGEII